MQREIQNIPSLVTKQSIYQSSIHVCFLVWGRIFVPLSHISSNLLNHANYRHAFGCAYPVAKGAQRKVDFLRYLSHFYRRCKSQYLDCHTSFRQTLKSLLVGMRTGSLLVITGTSGYIRHCCGKRCYLKIYEAVLKRVKDQLCHHVRKESLPV